MRATSLRRAPQRQIIDRTAGESRPLAPGACPHCFRVVSITSTGRRRTHGDGRGNICTGSRVHVGERLVTLTELPPVSIAPIRAIPRGLGVVASLPRSYVDNRRVALNGRGLCPRCSRELPLNRDGQIRWHRIRHQDPLAPYCTSEAS